MSPRSSEDQRTLIAAARHAITRAVLENRFPPAEPFPEKIEVQPGVFVTLYLGGRLRGCVGQVESVEPLAQTVARVAVDAALRDSRFSPLTREELDRLEIEISVLSAIEPITLETISVGRHGLLVDHANRRGLLLPKVAIERDWTAQRFLEETCAKAGLSRDVWKDSATRIYGFTVDRGDDK